MEFHHVSVLLKKSVDGLNIKKDGIYADGTLGGGGHSEEILRRLGNSGLVIGIDRDAEAIAASQKKLAVFDNVRYIHDNYKNIKNILASEGVDLLNGAVLDLGVSSYQLDNGERGFSYMEDAPLDMRMNQSESLSAYDVINTYSEQELTKIFFEYGEERFSKKIAKSILDRRSVAPVNTTLELVDIIKASIPERLRQRGSHPAKRVFQAVRIEVNGELRDLKNALDDFFDVLAPRGRLAVITFHSLEDRIVKNTFASYAKGCTCPPDFPVCVCGNKPRGKVLTRKPVLPDDAECEYNKRARSAKLRIVEKI